MIELIVYGKNDCANCTIAKNLIEQMEVATFTTTADHSISYTYKKLDVDFTREELLELFPDARTFPQITLGGELRTLDELKALAAQL